MISYQNLAKWELRLGGRQFRIFAPIVMVVAVALFLLPSAEVGRWYYETGALWFVVRGLIVVSVSALHFAGFWLCAIYPFGCFEWGEPYHLPERLSGVGYAKIFAAKSVHAAAAAFLGQFVVHLAHVLQNRLAVESFFGQPQRFGVFSVALVFFFVFVFSPLVMLPGLAWHARGRRTLCGGVSAVAVVVIAVIAAAVFFFSAGIPAAYIKGLHSGVIAGIFVAAAGVSVVVIRRCAQLYDNQLECEKTAL